MILKELVSLILESIMVVAIIPVDITLTLLALVVRPHLVILLHSVSSSSALRTWSYMC